MLGWQADATGAGRRASPAGLPMVAIVVALLGAAAARGERMAPAIPTEGLVLWLDASDRKSLRLEGDAIAAWRSRAAGVPGSLSSEGPQRPRYVPRPGKGMRPVVRFDGRNDVLRNPRFGRQAETWTLVVVAAASTAARGGGLCSACPPGGHDYDPGFTVDLYSARGQLDQVSIEGAGRIGGQQDQMQSSYAPGGLHVIAVERDAREVRLFVDGRPEGSRPVQPATTRMDAIRVGARCYSGVEQAFLAGDVAAVLLYDPALARGERRAVEAALQVSEAERQEGEAMEQQAQEERRRNRMVAPVVLQQWPSVAAYLEEKGLPAAPGWPIRTDLRKAIALGAEHLASLFDRDRDGEPFFYSNCRADGTGVMFHSVNIGIPHVVGRALLGVMMAERHAGIPCQPEGLAILERYLRQSFDNPDHLNSYADPARGNGRFVEFHNMREGLYGLVMLIEGRNAAWAREKAGLMLQTLDAITDAEGRWSVELARKRGMAERCEGLSVMNASRLIDPLLAIHRCMGDPLALKLAGLYARAALPVGFTPEGRFTPWEQSSGHIHSITSSLSGMTEYALLVKDAALLDACRRILDHGVPEYFSSWGWGDEVMPEHPADEPSRGEINQTGDVVRAALLLGAAGEPRYYELAERYLRSMLLPTQHREDELRRFLKDTPSPKDDSERGVLMRTVGGYSMQLPNDRMREGDWPLSTLDITSGAVHAMVECWRHRLTAEGHACRLNLLFDVESDDFFIKSGLPLRGRLDFVARAPKTLLVRVPEWVDAKTLRLSVGREERPVVTEKGYLKVAGLRAGDQGRILFDVPCRVERERVDAVTYTTTWAASQVVRIEPRGAVSPLPF